MGCPSQPRLVGLIHILSRSIMSQTASGISIVKVLSCCTIPAAFSSASSLLRFLPRICSRPLSFESRAMPNRCVQPAQRSDRVKSSNHHGLDGFGSRELLKPRQVIRASSRFFGLVRPCAVQCNQCNADGSPSPQPFCLPAWFRLSDRGGRDAVLACSV